VLALLRRTSLLPTLQPLQSEYLRSYWLPVGAAASVLALVPSLNQSKLTFACLALLGQVALYGSLIRMFEPSTDTKEGEYMQQRLTPLVRDIACRAIGVLMLLAAAMSLVLSPTATLSVGKAVLVGSIKATHWIVVFWIVGVPSPAYSLV
jgi:hypothetical protein